MWKRVWVVPYDLVLVGQRCFQDGKVDILHKFSADEERSLALTGELPHGASASSAGHPRCDEEGHEQALQALRDIHGPSRVALSGAALDDAFGFAYESE